MQDARVRAALLFIGLACLIGSAIVLFAGHKPQPPPVVITPPAETDSAATPQTPASAAPKTAARIYVDVSGAVRRPSLYVLPTGSRVMQAILAAGGPNAEADMDAVNLAEKVTDGEKVYVPKRGASPPPIAANVTDGSVPMTVPALSGPSSAVKGAKGSKASRSNKLTADSGEQIGLNSATAEQLERIPSIGPSMAARILAYRQQAGGFNKVEDLMQVTGIGPKKFAKIAPFVKLD